MEPKQCLMILERSSPIFFPPIQYPGAPRIELIENRWPATISRKWNKNNSCRSDAWNTAQFWDLELIIFVISQMPKPLVN